MYSKANSIVLRLCQITLLAQYFSSGLWKIRDSQFAMAPDEIVSRTLNYAAFAVYEGGRTLDGSLQIFIDYADILMPTGYYFVLFFQLGSLIPILFPKFTLYWGVLGVVFHLTTYLLMGLIFSPTLLASVYLLEAIS